MSGPITTSGNGQIQKRQERPGDGLARLLESMKGEMARALPKHISPDRMARVAITALRTTKDLALCTPVSFMACMLTLSQLGLEPNTPLGHAYLIPRGGKNVKPGTKECSLIIGYQGLIELARRSGNVLSIWATPVYEGDLFRVAYGLSPTIDHEPRLDTKRDKVTLTAVYAVARLRDTPDPVFVVVTKREIEAARMRGASGMDRSTPWDTDYEAMALKTAVRRLYKWLPKSIEIASALRAEDAAAMGHAMVSVVHDDVRDAIEARGHELPASTEAEAIDVDRDAGELTADEEARLAAEAGGA